MNRLLSVEPTVRVLALLVVTISLTGCATRNCNSWFPAGGGAVIPQSFAPGGTFSSAAAAPPVMTAAAPGAVIYTQPTYVQPTYANGPVMTSGAVMPFGAAPATAGVPLEALPTW